MPQGHEYSKTVTESFHIIYSLALAKGLTKLSLWISLVFKAFWEFTWYKKFII